MKLNDLRKYAIRNQVTVRFRLAGGTQCVLDNQGIIRTPGIQGPPDFNIGGEFDSIERFEIDGTGELTREQVAKLVGTIPVETHSDHDE